ncbi:GerAB/ArcD/ProY family transporter [Paenibacillus sp.]|uniref:GerAB/ArcD/ProY family transporter n=1 Tax=Paenibacillus sp. TaxID=58172 RepID=UPI002D5D2B70|nr:GerAB/ArcD/ProY family transporter [Paenibacillus sp.]HZG87699.1 GerAB/ArcD/ProY family transporter [Paenibacillus sp.]
MVRGNLTSFQLFSFMFLFELGSAIVVGLGMDAKQDAWLAVLLGMLPSVGIFAVYCYLYSHYPDRPVTDYIPIILGRWIGYPIAVVYIAYFIYIAGRILRDVGDLLIATNYNETPLFVVNGLLLLVVLYGVYLGLGTIGKAGELFLLIAVSFILFLLAALFLSPQAVKPEQLLPVLENGWKPVLATAFPLTATFPFGETIAFAAILPALKRRKSAWPAGASAIVLSGLLLAAIRAVDIAVLGAQYAAGSQFPFLETTRRISIGDFVQRMDALVLSTLVISAFFKIAAFGYAAVAGIRCLLRQWNVPAWLPIVAVAAAAYVASLKMARNVVEHLETGLELVPKTMHVPLQYAIPLLLAAVVFIRGAVGASGPMPGANADR